MRLTTLVGLLFAVLCPLETAASVVSPDTGEGWKHLTPAVAAQKRGRDESALRARGRAGPEAETGAWIPAARMPTQASPKHQSKTQTSAMPSVAAGKNGPEKALMLPLTEREGLSLVGEIQLLSALPAAQAVPPRSQVGFYPLIAGIMAMMLGLTMVIAGYRATAKEALDAMPRERGPYTRPAHTPVSRRWLRESYPPLPCRTTRRFPQA